MELIQTRDDRKLVIQIKGQLNTITAPELEAILGDNLADVDELVLDMKEMQYTSSAGLRAILWAQQTMEDKDGSMVIREASEETGFADFLDFED